MNIYLKYFGYIVIELIIKGMGMYIEYGFIKFVGMFCELFFNIVKIRDWFWIIIFYCVGIEVYKFYIFGYEWKVCIVEYLLECIFFGF